MNKEYGVSIIYNARPPDSVFRFRQKIFRKGKPGLDIDKYDDRCHHFMLHDQKSGDLVCVFRALLFKKNKEIYDCYSSQFYDLKSLQGLNGNMLEVGRFCLDENNKDPNILRLAWNSISRFILQENVKIIFGCTSFEGVDETNHFQAFALLKEKYLTSIAIQPIEGVDRVFEYAKDLKAKHLDHFLAFKNLPPLLRLYLKLGAKVSNSAIVDYDLRTIHVFTLYHNS